MYICEHCIKADMGFICVFEIVTWDTVCLCDGTWEASSECDVWKALWRQEVFFPCVASLWGSACFISMIWCNGMSQPVVLNPHLTNSLLRDLNLCDWDIVGECDKEQWKGTASMGNAMQRSSIMVKVSLEKTLSQHCHSVLYNGLWNHRGVVSLIKNYLDQNLN